MSRTRTLAATLCLALTLAQTILIPRAAAQTDDIGPSLLTPEQVVSQANNAFIYRDLERVIELLYPWLHPRRIVDRALAIKAYELLGVSLHRKERVKEAKTEFSSLLRLAPNHKLDPFLVPPAVIEAFEEVRRSLAGKPDPCVEPIVRPVSVPPLAAVALPGGTPQFIAGEIEWGLLWAVLQVGFLTLNVIAYEQAGQQRGSTADVWTGMQFLGLGGFLGSWTASGVQGFHQIKATRKRILEKARTIPPTPSELEELRPGADPSVPGIVQSWRF